MMKLSPLIISMLVFGGVMLGISSYYSGINSIYSPNMTLINTADLNRYEGIMNRTNQTIGRVAEHTAGFVNKDITDWTKYYDATLIFLSVLGVIAELPSMAVSFLSVTISIFGVTPFTLPGWFKLMAGTAIVTAFIMIIAAIATKRDEV